MHKYGEINDCLKNGNLILELKFVYEHVFYFLW